MNVLTGDWRTQAACKAGDADLFFPDPGASDEDINQAKSICDRCPVRQLCLDDAIKSGEKEAIAGGLTPKERERLLRGMPSRFHSRSADGMTGREVAMDRGADLLVWLVKKQLPVERVAELLGVNPRVVYVAFLMLVPPSQERTAAPSAVERVLGESSLLLRTLVSSGRTHVQVAQTLGTSQNVVSACVRVLEQRDTALRRVGGDVEAAVKRLQAEERRVRQEVGMGLTVDDVIALAGVKIKRLHEEGKPLRHVAAELGMCRETVRLAYKQLTTGRTRPSKLTQNEMESAA